MSSVDGAASPAMPAAWPTYRRAQRTGDGRNCISSPPGVRTKARIHPPHISARVASTPMRRNRIRLKSFLVAFTELVAQGHPKGDADARTVRQALCGRGLGRAAKCEDKKDWGSNADHRCDLLCSHLMPFNCGRLAPAAPAVAPLWRRQEWQKLSSSRPDNMVCGNERRIIAPARCQARPCPRARRATIPARSAQTACPPIARRPAPSPSRC